MYRKPRFAKPDDAVITRLKKAGVTVIPVARTSNYLSASFFTAGPGADSLVKMLEPLKKQLVWLKLDNAAISDATMDELARLTSLTKLSINHTAITDKGLIKLQSLGQLQSLNLVGTKVTAQGVMQLNKLKKLENLYLYQSALTNQNGLYCKKHFRHTI